MYNADMPDCLFCKIANKEIPSDVVFEDDRVFAFLDINPSSSGHTMVIPKTHANTLSDLPEEEIQPFFSIVKKTVGAIRKSVSPDGFTLGMNYGRAAGQEVDHMHFHIIPRWNDDGGSSLQSVVHNKPSEELSAIAECIKNSF